MTFPQFDDTPTENLGGEKRDPSEYVPWTRVAEVKTPRGTRPGLVMIVRPTERIRDYRDKNPENDWKTLVIADIAILDPIGPGADEYGMPLDAIPAGSQWRNQTVFPGMLNKAWRDKIGGTLIGIVYMGEAKPTAQGTMGKAPFLWRSLSQDANQVSRGQRFFAARPEFLIPIPRETPPSAASQPGPDPWAAQDQYYQQHSVHPAQTDAWAQQQPAQTLPAQSQQAPQGYGHQQPDPWAQSPSVRVSAAPQQNQPGMSTLEQIQAAARNAQGAQQNQDPPF